MQRRFEFGRHNNENRHGSAAGICTPCHSHLRQSREKGDRLTIFTDKHLTSLKSMNPWRENAYLLTFAYWHIACAIQYAQASTRLCFSVRFRTDVSFLCFSIWNSNQPPMLRPKSRTFVSSPAWISKTLIVRPPPMLIIMHERLYQHCRYQTLRASRRPHTLLISIQK